ncbi:AAA family ATPase [Paracoccus caeni]|uniref:AAA family ATPase n=1 Tax=Paracoccus caeni TaxID=657651 RepID=A0A934SG79_9RHOB|nr:AAA family ATPase [Paracoccus caeni]
MAGLTGKRVLVAVAGAPGSGKSTLAAELVKRLPGAALVPMDGFHLDDLLLAERGLLARKGAVETFDADGFAALVARLAQPDREVIYPIFDRSREIAIAGSGVVSADQRIVVIEGNYLLLDLHPWNEIHYDLTICLDVPETELQRRLTERWQGFGKKPEAIRAHLENDLANAHRVIVQSMEADIVIEATI